MKIVTFNINNINKRLDNLLAWLGKSEPDVVCLQELKAEQTAFPAQALRDAGLRRSLAGRAFLERRGDPRSRQQPVLTRSSLPGNPEDRQARYIEAAVTEC